MKHIQTMKTALEGFNAVARAAAAQMDDNARRVHPSVLESTNAPVRAGMLEAGAAAREKIIGAHAEALTAVDSWEQIVPEKLDEQTMQLLSRGLPMTAVDFRRLILRFEDNYAMLTALATEAEKRGLLFQCGYIPTPADKRAVYDAYYSSAMSMLDTIAEHCGISENMIAAYADASHLSDPRYISVLRGLSATQPGHEGSDNNSAPAADFGFKFRHAAPAPTRW